MATTGMALVTVVVALVTMVVALVTMGMALVTVWMALVTLGVALVAVGTDPALTPGWHPMESLFQLQQAGFGIPGAIPGCHQFLS